MKKLELPSVEDFQHRVEERVDEMELSMAAIDDLIQGVIDAERCRPG